MELPNDQQIIQSLEESKSNLVERIRVLQDRLLVAQQSHDKIVVELNSFRTLMFSVGVTNEDAESILSEDEMKRTYNLLQLKAQWHILEPDFVFRFLQAYEDYYNAFAEVAYKIKSKTEIKKHLEKKSKDAKQVAVASIEEAEQQKLNKKPFWKTVNAYIKMNIPREKAIEMVRAMGIKE